MIWLWALSLLVLIVSILFVYHILSSSKELFSVDMEVVAVTPKVKGIRYVADLNEKIKSLEETTKYYQALFNDFKQQLSVLESTRIVKADELQNDGDIEEDWKELYFEENEKKQDLENELDSTCQRLEELENELQTLQQQELQLKALKSEAAGLRLQNGELKHQLERLSLKLQDYEMLIIRNIELEKTASLQDFEKKSLKNGVEALVSQNRMFRY